MFCVTGVYRRHEILLGIDDVIAYVCPYRIGYRAFAGDNWSRQKSVSNNDYGGKT